MPIDWDAFARRIHAADRFLLTSHIRPDCDALGSELGMAHVLESLGKQVRIVNGQATPTRLSFIDPQRRIEHLGDDLRPDELTAFDALMVLDTSAWAQLGPMSEVVREANFTKLILDHHVSSDDLGALEFKDPRAEATGRLVIEAADALGVELTEPMARPLLAAIATDTGWFRFSSVNAGTLEAAARLVAAGANPSELYASLYEQQTLARVNLVGRILSRTETHCHGRLAISTALREDFEETGASPADTEDVINMTLQIANVEAAVLFVEQNEGGCKVSFRSRGALDCSKLAELFGGGGHMAAAGAMFNGNYDVAKGPVLDALRTALG